MTGPLDPFIPAPDARERFAVTVRAPAPLVYEVACTFDMQSTWSVRTIFRMRERIMGSRPVVRVPRGLVEELVGLGWGCLLKRPGELFVGGAVCQPWLADVRFRAVQPDVFAAFTEPGLVKIAWTLQARALGVNLSELSSETRVAATRPKALPPPRQSHPNHLHPNDIGRLPIACQNGRFSRPTGCP